MSCTVMLESHNNELKDENSHLKAQLLEVRQQADKAKKQADEAKKQADEAKKQADEAKKQADEAKKQADEAKKQAEEARKAVSEKAKGKDHHLDSKIAWMQPSQLKVLGRNQVQKAMHLEDDKDLYLSILQTIRDLTTQVNLDIKKDYHSQPHEKIGKLFHVPHLAKFENDWATAEILKQFLHNKCKPKKHARESSSPGEPSGSDQTKCCHVNDLDGSDSEMEELTEDDAMGSDFNGNMYDNDL
ncbi:hypothetical protein PISMIDRAFT_16427 [Pisolithus microcarpus 441]|uniref:Uncharacterized protein n=1 Tax=Pisolithus microcarpus 441 TaxID=765257 RepID=A0A0C9XTC6_9AGAM|nr:hypothetical protein BKA83DRAFT_16427 [Pisolithus microcarpus]KIK15585.1 hypothetical protein PISMIDRAFT_16427 [Pisolithus microcarpus 441]